MNIKCPVCKYKILVRVTNISVRYYEYDDLNPEYFDLVTTIKDSGEHVGVGFVCSNNIEHNLKEVYSDLIKHVRRLVLKKELYNY